ncbi:hypothetical protein, partial [Pseudomonas sp. NPDC089569]|uniref:hypothetical protein n=1 Tax=Pseudomonas sp. NPDC089569 TaxID=3390722 RepID=UPI003CFD7F7A
MGLSGRLRSLLDTTSVDSPELQELPITKQSLLGDSKKCEASNVPLMETPHSSRPHGKEFQWQNVVLHA